MTPAELSAWAGIPQELAELIFAESRKHNIDVPTIRSDLKHRHIVAARRDIAIQAKGRSFSYPTIARAMNRDHTSVRHLVVTA